jgi:fructokinase
MGERGVVVVAGEALIDLVTRADGTLEPLVGGGPLNAARALGRLEQPTAFIGGVSRDRLGKLIVEALRADGVNFNERLLVDQPTSLAVAELDAAGSASYRFYFSGTSAEGLAREAALSALPREVAALHVGGLGLVLEPTATAVEALVGQVAGRSLVMLDPNVRPSLITDRQAYAARLARIVSKADVVKVSDDDLRLLSPGRPPQQTARTLLTQGPTLVLLTLGSKGAMAIGTFGAYAVTAPKVAVEDTIGAGDTFSGAWLARWLQLDRPLTDREAVLDATRFACQAAAFSCTRKGASPPTLAEMEQMTGGE